MTTESIRKDLLALSSPPPIEVKLRGRSYFVKVMTAFEAVQLQKALEKNRADDGRESGRLLAMIICDEKGDLVFSIDNPDDVDKLSKLPPDIPRALLAVSGEANGGDRGN